MTGYVAGIAQGVAVAWVLGVLAFGLMFAVALCRDAAENRRRRKATERTHVRVMRVVR